MKTFFLVSDNTVIVLALIPSVFGVITLLVQAAINARSKRMEKKYDKNVEQMNGHVTKLVETTAELSEAVGLKKGKAEEKAKMIPIIEEKVKAAKDAGKIEGIELEKKTNGPHKNGEENTNQ